MLYSHRIHVSEGNDVNETSESNDKVILVPETSAYVKLALI